MGSARAVAVHGIQMIRFRVSQQRLRAVDASQLRPKVGASPQHRDGSCQVPPPLRARSRSYRQARRHRQTRQSAHAKVAHWDGTTASRHRFVDQWRGCGQICGCCEADKLTSGCHRSSRHWLIAAQHDQFPEMDQRRVRMCDNRRIDYEQRRRFADVACG